MCDGRAEESLSAKTRTPPEMEKGRGLGNPQMWANYYVTRAPLRKLTRRAKGSARNVRHNQPVRHARLEMLEYAGLSSRHVDRQRLTVCHPKLDDIGAVALGTVDHDAVSAALGRNAHLRRSFGHGWAASRATTKSLFEGRICQSHVSLVAFNRHRA